MERFVITGPTGWIGHALLHELSLELGEQLADRVRLFGSTPRTITLTDGRELQVHQLGEIGPQDTAGAHLVHLAYLTKEKVDSLGEADFVATNRSIDDAVLAAAHDGPPKSIFVASSGAARGAEDGSDDHAYAACKLQQEQRFANFAQRLSIPLVVGRIFALAGPYINKVQSYAVSNMLVQALETGEIRIAANKPVFRSYLHVGDLARIIIASARQGVSRATPVDLCGAEIVEMSDLARAIATIFASDVRIVRDRIDLRNYSAYLGSFADTKMLAMELGLQLTPLGIQICETRAWLSLQSRYELSR